MGFCYFVIGIVIAKFFIGRAENTFFKMGLGENQILHGEEMSYEVPCFLLGLDVSSWCV